jgi:EAL domain-containing protein (putative c-di-GMP-specific phosphodiesterase class I)
VEKIVAFARQIGITTIAEYVESEEILKAVKELNIDYSQGFFLGEPKPARREGIACIQAAGLAGL